MNSLFCQNVDCARLIVGLNPAWQKTLQFKQFNKGRVNRAETVHSMASGKGINTVQACRNLGHEAKVLQFAGGEVGELLKQDLDERNIKHITIPIQNSTRVCTTLLDHADNSMTELIEPSPMITPSQINVLNQQLSKILPKCRALALCGTLPEGLSSMIYADIVEQTREHAWIVVDAYRDLSSVLKANPQILKINGIELTKLTGNENHTAAVHDLFAEFNLLWIAITEGPDEAAFYSRQKQWRYQIPKLEKVISPLGAGDTATGTILAEVEKQIGPMKDFNETEKNYELASNKMAECFRFALAAASASCLSPYPAEMDKAGANRLIKQIAIKEIDSH